MEADERAMAERALARRSMPEMGSAPAPAAKRSRMLKRSKTSAALGAAAANGNGAEPSPSPATGGIFGRMRKTSSESMGGGTGGMDESDTENSSFGAAQRRSSTRSSRGDGSGGSLWTGCLARLKSSNQLDGPGASLAGNPHTLDDDLNTIQKGRKRSVTSGLCEEVMRRRASTLQDAMPRRRSTVFGGGVFWWRGRRRSSR